jgi:hypothetical protein
MSLRSIRATNPVRKIMIRAFTLIVMLAISGFAACAGALQRDRNLMVAQNSPPEVCTEVYQPVCGTDQNGKRVTYSNACFARVAKATNVTPGECPK